MEMIGDDCGLYPVHNSCGGGGIFDSNIEGLYTDICRYDLSEAFNKGTLQT